MKRFAVCLVVGACLAPAGVAQADSLIVRSGYEPVEFRLTSSDPWALAVVVWPNDAWATIPDTQWVSVARNRVGPPAGATYRSAFTLPAHAYARSVAVAARADNGIALSLNGTQFGSDDSAATNPCGVTFQAPTAPVYSTSNSFVPGANTLSFLVDNCPRPGIGWNDTGLDFKATVNYSVDDTPPVLTFSGDRTYDVTETVNVSCSASDPTPGSGLASDPCTAPLKSGPAYSFNPGVNNVGPVTATDKVGNATTASTTFTVRVTAAGLCTLTSQMVQASAKYQALPVLLRSTVNTLVTRACAKIDAAVATLSPSEKALLISGYGVGVDFLASASQGYLTPDQAARLKAMAAAL
jgi:hypothetical protein